MRPQEAVSDFKPKLREYTNYSVRGIKKVCQDFGPRPCGTDAEKNAQEYMAKAVEGYADTVEIEPFDVHPKAFLGWFIIDGILALIAIAAYNWLPIVTMVATLFAVIFVLGEFLIYRELIDFLFPKKTSRNVFATRKASGEAKKHIIFCGHIDSSYEWTYTYRGGKVLLFAGLGSAIAGLVLLLVMSVLAAVQGAFFIRPDGFASVLGWISLAFIPSFIGLLIFLNYKVPVEGANDNLTGVFVSAAVLKYMADNNIRFENTDVSFLSTGGEEAGLRGAAAFARKHKAELNKLETCFVISDTMRDYEHMAVYTKDMSGVQKNHPQASAMVQKAGEFAGVKLPFAYLYAGASDAAAISREKIPAASFAAMDPGPPRYYHTRLDSSDNMDAKTIEKSIEILIESLYLFDDKGLQDSY